jgi:hypothetical protein
MAEKQDKPKRKAKKAKIKHLRDLDNHPAVTFRNDRAGQTVLHVRGPGGRH